MCFMSKSKMIERIPKWRVHFCKDSSVALFGCSARKKGNVDVQCFLHESVPIVLGGNTSKGRLTSSSGQMESRMVCGVFSECDCFC